MSYFACIHFEEDNIIIAKGRTIRFEPIKYLGIDGYDIFIPFTQTDMTLKQWKKLENQLEDYGVEYIVMKECEKNPFENQILMTGKEIKFYLAKAILDYINKYKLVKCDKLYTKIGIIGGTIHPMLAVIASIVEHTSDLTLFVESPIMYQPLLKEIYDESRLKAKALVPSSIGLSAMDIVFDCSGTKNYAKWCSPKAIYIDFYNYFEKKDTRFQKYPPMIWHDFDIICDRQQIDLCILQSILCAQGISKKKIPLTLKQINLRIARVYQSCIS